ncbi:4'-phosphopantetheinyl transferase family protein [Agromyces aureus]|uniref:4'-phosphopantetheinyl transferase family protein n=1 Tax=Agromyces aureus TaxID=453304 RepID=UPI0013747533|nr:4'-phosphopantetheinyl transferase superfamily protein [Agromyces aureus]
MRERRDTGRAWAEELSRTALDGAWPGFRPDRRGRKPMVNGDHGLDVSISHSGSLMLVAVALGAPVGVDLEVVPFDAFTRPQLVRRMCSSAELDVFTSVPDGPVRRRALARAWTVKEATLKARGVGLAEDPRTVEVDAESILAEVVASPVGVAAEPEASIVRLLSTGAELRHPLDWAGLDWADLDGVGLDWARTAQLASARATGVRAIVGRGDDEGPRSRGGLHLVCRGDRI